MNNEMPTLKQVARVIRGLKRIEHLANKEDALNMMCTSVCGTVGCVAGWYAYSNRRSVFFKDCDMVTYSDDADLMAKHLGFADKDNLEYWAEDHPEIWGNKDGNYMFCSSVAYNNGEYPHEPTTGGMSIVIKHWEGVYKRLEKHYT